MQKDKVSEKVIWEDYNPSDDSVSQTIAPESLAQSQMMFCYNCNKVIPGDSKFCPWCQIKLYTQCPKCGYSYSSQYPNCNQCGINVKEYLIEQEILALQRKKEKEEREYREREERRKQEEERRLQEQIRQREIEVQRVLDEKRKREAELRLKEEMRKREEIDNKIVNSREYKEALQSWIAFCEYKQQTNIRMLMTAILLIIVTGLFTEELLPIFSEEDVLFWIVICCAILGVVFSVICLDRTTIFGNIKKVFARYIEHNPCPPEVKVYLEYIVENIGKNEFKGVRPRLQLLRAFRKIG